MLIIGLATGRVTVEQIQVTMRSVRARALSILQKAQQASQVGRPQPDFIALTPPRESFRAYAEEG